MMDTILNLGLNDETVKGLAAKSGNERFAYDSYRRFIQMYSNVVLGVDHGVFEDILDNHKNLNGFSLDTDLGADDWLEVIDAYKEAVERETGKPFPQATREQLWGAIGAVFGSWQNQRANTYRRLHGIPDSWGTAVNVQAMVFGNLGDTSATGVAFTRNPSTGAREIYGEFLINAQGEDVVAGIRTPQPLTEAARKEAGEKAPSLEAAMPDTYRQLRAGVRQLEKRYRDMQDIEFTIQDGKLWMLQTRSGKRTTKAALKIAVDLVAEGLITPQEAVLRIDADALDQLLHPTIDPDAPSEHVLATRPAGLAGRRLGRDRVRRRRGRGAERPGPRGDPGARRDQPRGHPRHARRGRHPHHARRHDQPRRRGRARHGPALRVRRRRAAHRRQGRHHDGRRPDLPQGRRHHHRRRQGRGAQGPREDAPARAVGRLRAGDAVGGRGALARRARQRRHAARGAARRATSAPRASACAAPSTCSSRKAASSPCAR